MLPLAKEIYPRTCFPFFSSFAPFHFISSFDKMGGINSCMPRGNGKWEAILKSLSLLLTHGHMSHLWLHVVCTQRWPRWGAWIMRLPQVILWKTIFFQMALYGQMPPHRAFIIVVLSCQHYVKGRKKTFLKNLSKLSKCFKSYNVLL